MTTRPSQAEMENLFSQRNIHLILHKSIEYQLDKMFLVWCIGAYIRLNEYITGTYYASKDKRMLELQSLIDDKGADHLIIATIAAVIKSKRDQTLNKVVGYMEPYMPHDKIKDRFTTAGELLTVLGGKHSARWYELLRTSRTEAPTVMVHHSAWRWILRVFRKELEWIDDTFYNPPLVERPLVVDNNDDCGYFTVYEPVILGSKWARHNKPLNLDVLNTLNQIEWYLDPEILQRTERPAKPLTTEEDQKIFKQHTRTANRIYKVLGTEEPFYIVWQYDSRGRLYSHGHHVNLQSYEYKKALLTFGPLRVTTSEAPS